MHAVLLAVPAAAEAIIFPLLLTIGLATVALAAVAVYLRRLRFSGRLSGINGSASAACAALVLAAALFVSVSLGNAPAALANTVVSQSPAAAVQTPTAQPVVSDDLDGFQLPTK